MHRHKVEALLAAQAFEDALAGMPDKAMTGHIEVVDPKNRAKSDDKLVQCAHIMMPDLALLDETDGQTKYLRCTILGFRTSKCHSKKTR